ncbi:substrate-binding domain-containing protein [Marinospirillum sp.]|uniref:substrate-binding domain-containing protein n=1 Tax=Marinospirillum sp. TaxID=2183934 RepID=UPI0028707538|nr:substrate-binding domain-containing protein [Marinospirillum sp.]MDR9467242.1 substrate-binding domain-containing protein [Marinospirillum sp.]
MSRTTPRIILLLMIGLLAWGVQASERKLIGFAQDTLGNDWRVAQVRAVEKALAEHSDIDFIYTDAQGETSLQARHIEKLAEQGVDLIITSPRDQDALAPVIEQVYRQGIPVILLSRSINNDSYTSFVTLDNKAIARSAGRYLVDELEGQGHILMLEGVDGASTTQDRAEGFMEVVATYPEIKVTRRTANFLRADAILTVSELLAEGVEFDAIYSQSDSMATGARMALTQAGIDPGSVLIAGIDFISEAQEAIRKGDQDISFTYQTGGAEGARLAIQVLQGKEVPKKVTLDSIAVTRDNVDQVEPIF